MELWVWTRACLGAALIGAAGCRTVSGPEQVAEAYARALEENRLDDAHRLTAAQTGEPLERFKARYAIESERRSRAQQILAGLEQLRLGPDGLAVVREEGRWKISDAPPAEGPKEVLARFIAAAERGDFTDAYQLLAAPWRAVYTPERLRQDFAAEPLAGERLARARAALAGEVVWTDGGAELPIAEGASVKLVREGGAFKVAALE